MNLFDALHNLSFMHQLLFVLNERAGLDLVACDPISHKRDGFLTFADWSLYLSEFSSYTLYVLDTLLEDRRLFLKLVNDFKVDNLMKFLIEVYFFGDLNDVIRDR